MAKLFLNKWEHVNWQKMWRDYFVNSFVKNVLEKPLN